MKDYKPAILDALHKLYLMEMANKDRFRSRAFKNVIMKLRETNTPIYSIDDIKDMEGVGKGILRRVEKIMNNKNLTELKNYDERLERINNLAKIQGLGTKKAKELVEKFNIKTITELKKHQELLNDTQKKGLVYYNDFKESISRIEITKHYTYIEKIIKNINSHFIVKVVGSYRRQSNSSDKIDILITSKINTNLKEIINKLKQVKYIKDDFSLGLNKYYGVCKLDKKLRHINILYVKQYKFPFAMLYFTGPSLFNLKIRKVAKDLGYTLSEHGLKYNRGENKDKFVSHKFNNEKDIFNFIGLKYIPPKQRTDDINIKKYFL